MSFKCVLTANMYVACSTKKHFIHSQIKLWSSWPSWWNALKWRFEHYFAKDFARNLVPGFSTFLLGTNNFEHELCWKSRSYDVLCHTLVPSKSLKRHWWELWDKLSSSRSPFNVRVVRLFLQSNNSWLTTIKLRYQIIIMHLSLSIIVFKTFKTWHNTENFALLADRA